MVFMVLIYLNSLYNSLIHLMVIQQLNLILKIMNLSYMNIKNKVEYNLKIILMNTLSYIQNIKMMLLMHLYLQLKCVELYLNLLNQM